MYPGAIAENDPEKLAFLIPETGESMTYGELHKEACQVAHLFRNEGLKPGDHVALCMENHFRFFPIVWGAQYAGLFYTAISSRLKPAEVAYIVNDCGAEVFFGSNKVSAMCSEIVADTPKVRKRIGADGEFADHESYESTVKAQSEEMIEGATEGREMLYSSGTTGKPKGVKVPLTGDPIGNPDALFTLLTLLFGVNNETVYLSPAPLYHAAPLRYSMGIHRAGGTVIQMQKFDPVKALEFIEKHQVTFAQMVPTMFVRMLKLDESTRNSFDTSSLTHVVHAAAPCPQTVKRAMIEWWGPIIHEYYAGTEGNGFCYCNSEEWLAHPGTVGKSLLGPVHILDEEFNEVPKGETGGVYFESAQQFSYYNDEAKTKESYDSRGWSTLGDIGYLDEDDYLHLTDRKAYMVISGGVNIYPQEAENVLTMHPAIDDVAVFGIPDDDLGEMLIAVVQPAPDSEPGPELAQEIMTFCESNLSRMKCPRRIDFRDELPRHPTGKLYKRLLKDEYLAMESE